MKKLLAGIAFLGIFALASAQTISFDKTTYEYGTIKPGSDGHRFFTVTNIGDKPLIISDVRASCGCTTPEWSKDPILPKQSAKIKVGYNTAINGTFRKQIEVFSNDPENSRSVIYIAGNVDPNAPEVAEPAKPVATAVAAPAPVKATKPAKVKKHKVVAKK